MKRTAEYWIQHLGLQEHPEGGYFSETYRSPGDEDFKGLGTRNHSTAIYFLVTKGRPSNFHRLKTDEVWHFYDGSPCTIISLMPNGLKAEQRLGLSIENGEKPQMVVGADKWFGVRVEEESQQDFCLVGCTMAPGFDFQDFELAKREELVQKFPQHGDLVKELTSGE